MKKLKITDCAEKLQRLGRIFDGPNGELFLNWTCAGLRFLFQGTCLVAVMNAIASEETDRNPADGTISCRKNWPYVAIFIDDCEEPAGYFEVNDIVKNYLMFSSETEETHIITIRKITENSKGKLSVSQFLTDGSIEKAAEDNKKIKLEFIGDSITSGFGNLSNDKDRGFFTCDENGWLSHAAIASRRLKADFSIVSYSGIAITKGLGKIIWPSPSMKELYLYTDRLIEEEYGKWNSFEIWNFKQFIPDVIILNLGTNDATIIDLNEDNARGILQFETEYYQFLEMLRQLNGADPWIICALGSMDYFLYDVIQRAVESFSKEKNDHKLRSFKYGRIRWMTEGYGACGHPNITTQIRMGQEIADFITELMQ